MKRSLFSLGLVLAAVSMAGVNAAAQVRESKESASEQAVRTTGKAERRLDNISFRITLKTEWFAERDGEVFKESQESLTVESPDRYQSINESGEGRTETIVIAGKSFRRINDGDWESVAVPPIRKAGDPNFAARFGDLAGGASRPVGEGKLVARGTLEGQEVSMYEVRNVRRDSTPEGSSRTESATYWINNDGLIVRRIVEHEFANDPRIMRSTANYTYSNISIDEPILPVTAKK